jgi:hypothetical protein
MSGWGGDIDGGSGEVGVDEGGVGSERSGAGEGKGETRDLRRMDKGIRLVAEAGGRPRGESGGGDETETGQL